MTDLITRAAPTVGSANLADRTVDVIFATETPVKRYSYSDGYYMEVLAVEPGSIRTDRFDTGMSVLDTHDHSSMESRLGSVVPGSLRIKGRQAIATLKFSDKPAAERVFQDIVAGHRTPISVGYRIDAFEKTEAQQGGLPIVRATSWTPLEISVVPIPADPNAHTRANHEVYMSQQNETLERPEDHGQARAETIFERTRIKRLRELARSAGLPDTELERAIDAGTSVDVFRSQALDYVVRQEDRTSTFPHVQTRDDTRYGGMTRQQAMTDALLARVDGSHKPKDASREFVGLSCTKMARRSLEASGASTSGMSASQVIERALHTTSDFPVVISAVGQTTLQAAYEALPSALKAAGRKTTVKDFKAKTAVRLGGGPNLDKVNEHGEFRRGTFGESAESYRIDTYGKVFGMTRQMLINDQLGAFADVAQKLGKKAADLEAKLLVDLLKSNPKMGDGKALFHADHKNLESPAGLSVDALAGARTAFRKQVDDTGELIGVAPKYLVVGADLETAAERVLAQITAAKTSDVNVFAGKLELVVEPRLTDPTEWYLAASPDQVAGLEYAYLEGEEGPQFFERVGFDVDGLEIKVRLDFGAGFMDWRGWYRNAGQ